MTNFKHHPGKPPVTLHLSASKENTDLCPVLAMWEYCKIRGSMNGPMFVYQDHVAVSRHAFSQQLRISLTLIGYDTKIYKGHYFRIGAASWAKSKGVSDDQIQMFGCWKSDAYKKYIRIPLLNI